MLVIGVRGMSEGREEEVSTIVTGACGDLRCVVRRMVGVVERKSPPKCSSGWVEGGIGRSGGREEGMNGRKGGREASMDEGEGRENGEGKEEGKGGEDEDVFEREREGGRKMIRKRGDVEAQGEKGKSMSGQGSESIVFARALLSNLELPPRHR